MSPGYSSFGTHTIQIKFLTPLSLWALSGGAKSSNLRLYFEGFRRSESNRVTLFWFGKISGRQIFCRLLIPMHSSLPCTRTRLSRISWRARHCRKHFTYHSPRRPWTKFETSSRSQRTPIRPRLLMIFDTIPGGNLFTGRLTTTNSSSETPTPTQPSPCSGALVASCGSKSSVGC